MTDDRIAPDLERALHDSLHRSAPIADARLAERLLARTAATRQRRHWSPFSALGPALAAAAVVVLAVAAGLALRDVPANIGADGSPGATPTPIVSPSASPSPTAEATPSASVLPSASPTPSGFPDARRCTNDELGFEVAYPSEWHTNEEIAVEFADPIPACTYFDEAAFEIQPNAGLPPSVGIAIGREPEAQPEPSGSDVLQRDQAMVDGQPATVSEIEFAEADAFIEAGQRDYWYEVALPDGSILVARTSSRGGDDYEAHKAVLDRMMESLTLLLP
jgi:hypothetical protein